MVRILSILSILWLSLQINNCNAFFEEFQRYWSLEEESQVIQDLDTLISSIKKNGFPIGRFYITDPRNQEDIFKALSYQVPFLTKINDSWYHVRKIKVSPEISLYCVASNGEEVVFKTPVKWHREIIGVPPVSLFFSLSNPRNNTSPDVCIFFTFHYTMFEELKQPLNIIKDVWAGAEEVIYIDELGLIPPDSVQRYMKMYGLGEKDAYQKIKSLLNKELMSLSKGRTIYDSNPFYFELYKFLSVWKPNCYIEDLPYELWKKIVEVDKVTFRIEILKIFLREEFKRFEETCFEYLNNFILVNGVLRDKNLVAQINRLKDRTPASKIFTIRGIGHLGIISDVAQIDSDAWFFISCKKDILLAMPYKYWVYSFRKLGAEFPLRGDLLMYAYCILEDILGVYLANQGIEYVEAIAKAKIILGRIKTKDMLKKFVKKLNSNIDSLESLTVNEMGKLIFDTIKEISIQNPSQEKAERP